MGMTCAGIAGARWVAGGIVPVGAAVGAFGGRVAAVVDAGGDGEEGAEERAEGVCGCGDDAEAGFDGGPDCDVAVRGLVSCGGREEKADGRTWRNGRRGGMGDVEQMGGNWRWHDVKMISTYVVA